MDTSELIGAELDAAVAKALGIEDMADTSPAPDPMPMLNVPSGSKLYFFRPSSNWSDGGPIIERERIELRPYTLKEWAAEVSRPNEPGCGIVFGPTPLIAAMRAFVASKK